jgi:integrase
VRRAIARKEVGTPKNKQARFQVIPQALAEELREWLQQSDPNAELLFVGEHGGRLANNSLNRWYRRLAKEAAITAISSHGARHTSGSTYAVMGVGQKMIAKLLGHVSTKTTERYTHIQVSETQALVEARWAALRLPKEYHWRCRRT